jgi:hypothetical protein
MKNITANIVGICCFFCVLGCNPKKDEDIKIPEGILSEEKFTAILVDFALAESASNLNIKNAIVQKIDSVYAFNPLVDNGVRKSQYDSTVKFFTEHPEAYKHVYDNVITVLTEIEAKRKAGKKDSLKSLATPKPK